MATTEARLEKIDAILNNIRAMTPADQDKMLELCKAVRDNPKTGLVRQLTDAGIDDLDIAIAVVSGEKSIESVLN